MYLALLRLARHRARRLPRRFDGAPAGCPRLRFLSLHLMLEDPLGERSAASSTVVASAGAVTPSRGAPTLNRCDEADGAENLHSARHGGLRNSEFVDELGLREVARDE